MTKTPDFEWDDAKDRSNQRKHGISFSLAQFAFLDERRVILEDQDHSDDEKRYYCLGMVSGGIMTVRFTYRKKQNPNFWRLILAERKANI